ncbi:MAG: type I pullulanase [Breznakia sp.]
MRKTKTLEAYLDDFTLVNIFLSKQYYGGQAHAFYLCDEQGKTYPLEIMRRSDEHSTHNAYFCQLSEILDLSKKYDVYESHALSAPLEVGFVTTKKAFDEQYFYEGPLGVIVAEDTTSFYLWAPTATKVTVVINELEYHLLTRKEKGVYHLTLQGNRHLDTYYYLVETSGSVKKSLDPYGISGIANSKANAIIDITKLNVKKHYEPKPCQDVVIVETSVRDFTSALDLSQTATFETYTKTGLTLHSQAVGFDYLAALGASHVQLMPIHDFATVDEWNPQKFYNWGYDPVQYFSLEGSYASNPNDASVRMCEFHNLVRNMHKKDMRVIVDVVFNHIYELETSAFDICVPYYYFRYNEDNTLSNGSFCGNDLNSKARMFRRYILDVLKFYVEFYDVDGFRFDLMGILDIETMQYIDVGLRSIKADILLYGEGWKMPTALADCEKASMYNAQQLPNYAFFDDFFRDVIKGRADDYHINELGFLTGDATRLEDMKKALVGHNPYAALSEQQSIHYSECHDNLTLWDKIKKSCHFDSKETRIQKHKSVLAATLLAKGIPFIALGQEFCREKKGISNSYQSSDAINAIHWERMQNYQEVVDFTKDIIQLRKDYPILRSFNNIYDFEEIAQVLYFHQTKQSQTVVIAWNITNQEVVREFDECISLIFDGDKAIKQTAQKILRMRAHTCMIYIL